MLFEMLGWDVYGEDGMNRLTVRSNCVTLSISVKAFALSYALFDVKKVSICSKKKKKWSILAMA